MHEKNARTLALLIRLCDDLAWGRPADEDALFALTRMVVKSAHGVGAGK